MVGFGTSGIRDLSPHPVGTALARRLGQVLAAMDKRSASGQSSSPASRQSFPLAPRMSSSSHSPPSLSIGFDGRRSGHMLKSALAAGAMQMGAEVHDLGLCATPTLALHSGRTGGWGVMVTASHNPPQYNGLKVFFAGREVPDEWEREIERQLVALSSGPERCRTPYTSAGMLHDSAEPARRSHLKLALSLVNAARIKKARPRVVVDCANAAGCALMPALLRAAGCVVQELNFVPGEPYGRVLEPKAETLGTLSRAVRKFHADLGIAHDGDADRAIILDEKGRLLGLDTQLAMAVSDVLERGLGKKAKTGHGADAPNASSLSPPSIVSTVESTLSLREACAAHGARLLITPVGSRYVAAAMRSSSSLFGGEPCGEYLFPHGVQVPDGLASGLYFVDLFCRKGKLSVLAKSVRSYPVLREKISCVNEKKNAAMSHIEKEWPFFSPLRVDGLRSDFDDGWVMVRASGTEPILRITAEGKDDKVLRSRVSAVRAIVERAVR